jgi:putative membrane protein
MKLVFKIILRILANSAAIWVANYLIPGFYFSGSYISWISAGLVLATLNYLVKPILKLVTCPVIILTLGLFSVIINIFILFIAEKILPNLEISGIWPAFWGVIIISIINFIILSIFDKEDL